MDSLYLIVIYTLRDEVVLKPTTNHFDAGYQYNLDLSKEQHSNIFLIETVPDGLEEFRFNALDNGIELPENDSQMLAMNEPYSGHEDEEDEEPKTLTECCNVEVKTVLMDTVV